MAKRPAPTSVLSLAHREAADWNKSLMREFQAELEINPSADLMSMFHEPYLAEHRRAEYHELSYPAKYNREVLDDLYNGLKRDPMANLLDKFPKYYHRRFNMAMGPIVAATKEVLPEEGPEFRTRLDWVDTAKITFPLSESVSAAISNYSNESIEDEEERLAEAVRDLIWESPTIWEGFQRGVVVECCEGIVAKINSDGGEDTTEYTSMQFLAEKAPEIPAPRVHGRISLGPFTVIFMTLIPGITLEEAWEFLTKEDKSSIQQELEKIFLRLRSIPPVSKEMGGVCGEGVKEDRINDIVRFKGITTPQEYSDLGFSAKSRAGQVYVQFLQSFVKQEPSLNEPPVFSHGDVRTANIMVRRNPDTRRYELTGIVDWEESGFYPTFYESSHLTRNFHGREDDWYLFLPKCIAPSNYAIHWLANRVWEKYLSPI